MSSLSDVVKAMMLKKKENSTLDWDVVVNYSAKELNNLLKARHEQGGEGQLSNLSVQLPKHDEEGNPYDIDYDFILGAPLIQFTSIGLKPYCSVNIPIIGGTVKGKNGKIFTIDPDVYTLLVSAIPLASADGTAGAERNLQDSDQPFTFSSPNTTGVVTLHLGTDAADTMTVELQVAPEAPKTDDKKMILGRRGLREDEMRILGHTGLPLDVVDSILDGRSIVFDDKKGILGSTDLLKTNQGSTDFLLDEKKGNLASTGPKHVSLIDDERRNLADKIKTQLRDSHDGGKITWDLGHINNLSANEADNLLVPKSFRFAVYAPDNEAETVLSLFIQTDDTPRGRIKDLQAVWKKQWEITYKVSPIASPYTASVIFNNRLIISLMIKSAQGITILKSPDQPVEGGGLKFTALTHKKFYVRDGIVNGVDLDGADIDLDDEDKRLYITVGQNGKPDSVPSAQLEWDFSASVKWCLLASGNHGVVNITNKLRLTKSVDDSDLPNFLLHVDVGVASSDWETDIVAEEPEWWKKIVGAREWTFPVTKTMAIPSSMPSVKVEIINFKFFLTTNVLLPSPGSKVINFENGSVRFPKDLYVVGHVAESFPPQSFLAPQNDSSTLRYADFASSQKKTTNRVYV